MQPVDREKWEKKAPILSKSEKRRGGNLPVIGFSRGGEKGGGGGGAQTWQEIRREGGKRLYEREGEGSIIIWTLGERENIISGNKGRTNKKGRNDAGQRGSQLATRKRRGLQKGGRKKRPS